MWYWDLIHSQRTFRMDGTSATYRKTTYRFKPPLAHKPLLPFIFELEVTRRPNGNLEIHSEYPNFPPNLVFKFPFSKDDIYEKLHHSCSKIGFDLPEALQEIIDVELDRYQFEQALDNAVTTQTQKKYKQPQQLLMYFHLQYQKNNPAVDLGLILELAKQIVNCRENLLQEDAHEILKFYLSSAETLEKEFIDHAPEDSYVKSWFKDPSNIKFLVEALKTLETSSNFEKILSYFKVAFLCDYLHAGFKLSQLFDIKSDLEKYGLWPLPLNILFQTIKCSGFIPENVEWFNKIPYFILENEIYIQNLMEKMEDTLIDLIVRKTSHATLLLNTFLSKVKEISSNPIFNPELEAINCINLSGFLSQVKDEDGTPIFFSAVNAGSFKVAETILEHLPQVAVISRTTPQQSKQSPLHFLIFSAIDKLKPNTSSYLLTLTDKVLMTLSAHHSRLLKKELLKYIHDVEENISQMPPEENDKRAFLWNVLKLLVKYCNINKVDLTHYQFQYDYAVLFELTENRKLFLSTSHTEKAFSLFSHKLTSAELAQKKYINTYCQIDINIDTYKLIEILNSQCQTKAEKQKVFPIIFRAAFDRCDIVTLEYLLVKTEHEKDIDLSQYLLKDELIKWISFVKMRDFCNIRDTYSFKTIATAIFGQVIKETISVIANPTCPSRDLLTQFIEMLKNYLTRGEHSLSYLTALPLAIFKLEQSKFNATFPNYQTALHTLALLEEKPSFIFLFNKLQQNSELQPSNVNHSPTNSV